MFPLRHATFSSSANELNQIDATVLSALRKSQLPDRLGHHHAVEELAHITD